MRRKLSLHTGIAAGLAAVVTLAACGSAEDDTAEADEAAAEEPAEDEAAAEDTAGAAGGGLDQVCADAEAEDTMEAWLNFGNPDPIVAAFREAYPDVDIEVLTILTEDGAPRIVTEASSGAQPAADVVYGGLPSLAPIITRGLIDDTIDWEANGVDPELISGASNTVRVAQVAYGVGFNTERYSADELPDTWEGFLEAEWDGKLILDPRGRPFSFLSIEWGQEETVAYVQEMVDNVNPVVLQGTTAGLLAVASGEGDILLNSKTAETAEQVEAGAPLDIKLLDYVPVEGTQLGVLAGSEQPLAAQCFVGWAASEAGSAAILDADFKANELPPAPDGAVYVEIENEEELAIADATVEDLSAIIGGETG